MVKWERTHSEVGKDRLETLNMALGKVGKIKIKSGNRHKSKVVDNIT